MTRPSISSRALVAVSALYFTAALNVAFWRYVWGHLEVTNGATLAFALTLPAVLFMAHYVVFSLTLWPIVAKPWLAALLFLSGAANYCMYRYGIYIDADMMRNVFGTNAREAGDMVTADGLAWLAATALLPAALLAAAKIRWQTPGRELRFRALAVAVCLALTGAVAAATYKEYASFGRNHRECRRLLNTGNYIYATARYFQLRARAQRQFTPLDDEARLEPYEDPAHAVFIIIVGEAARAQNFSLYGYGRETNPRLAREDVLAFQNVASCGTATAISVPCLFSDRGRGDFDVVDSQFTGNLMDLLQTAGYQVWWRDNDDGCKGVCDRVPTEGIKGERYDDSLLDGLEGYLAAIDRDTVIVLHMRGSHGPAYYKRYPPEYGVFTPACDTADLQNCPRDSITNAYDNTVLYTDHVIASAIDSLKKFPRFESGLLYVSDHGQSLGENNIYLHGLPYAIAPKEQTRVPMILWLSPNMREYDRLDYGCLAREAREGSFSHDHVFHSLLGLLEVNSKTYRPELDLFAPCRLTTSPN